MDIIEQARELGRQIQKDDRYLKVQIAQQNSDNDKELQALIGEFNLKRMNINTEAQRGPQRGKASEAQPGAARLLCLDHEERKYGGLQYGSPGAGRPS